MIFVEYSLDEWIDKNPGLAPIKIRCSNCSSMLTTNRPFIERGYAGLCPGGCACGKNENRGDVRITTSSDTYERWMRLFSSITYK